MEMKKRFFRISLVVLLVTWLSWALSPLWKPVVYGYAPGVVVGFLSYDCGPSGPAGKVDFVPSAFELSDGVGIGYGSKPYWAAEEVNTNFTFDMPRYGNEHEVRMLINSDTGIVGAIAWDKRMEADPMTYALSGASPREWAEAQGLEWLELSSGEEWVVSLKEKSEHRILLVCEMKLKPEAPAGTQPYILLGVRMQLKEAAIEEGRKRIPAGLQL
ncbi:MAG: hypothetical protein IKK73_05730 [Akkermansia sp.]|nr:hypothetical protein [Akkermansia sp.]